MRCTVILLGLSFLVCVPLMAHTPEERHEELITQLIEKIGGEWEWYIKDILHDSRMVVVDDIFPSLTRAEARALMERVGQEMMTACSLADGVSFYDEHNAVFGRAEEEHGVDAATLLGLLRIETNFGKVLADHHPVVLTLYNRYMQAPDGPRGNGKRRSALHRLSVFLQIARENNWNVFEKNGSHEGAFGLTQFMPFWSSLFYTVDGDNDGRKDLYTIPDAVLSSARYLEGHGWKRGVASAERRALMAYNPSRWYVDTILEYRAAIAPLLLAND